MRQTSLADNGFEKYRKKTRKEQFLQEMESSIPWEKLSEAIEPFYPNPQGAGRRPVGIEIRGQFTLFTAFVPGSAHAIRTRLIPGIRGRIK